VQQLGHDRGDPRRGLESLATEEGRDRWLEDDPEREIHVEVEDEPSRLVWWWWTGDEPATRVEFLVVAAPAGARVVVTESIPTFSPAAFGGALALVARVPLAALADPTRRRVVETPLRDGSPSAPALSATLPITRQAIAKHLATVRYQLRAGALGPAAAWLGDAEAACDDRLAKLKKAVERRPA
jgi:hypothetical protein